jgi:hypothetical protein
LVALALAFVGLMPAALAYAAPAIELTRGSGEPVESITTQLGATVTNGGNDELSLFIKPTGGAGCAANPDADSGETVIDSLITSGVNPVRFAQNWTVRVAGEYRVCAWVTGNDDEEVLAAAETTFHVRQPHLALSISAPATAALNQTFQVLTTAQAETEREVREYVLPNAGDGCPANAAAARNASGEEEVLYWNVTGGPLTESRNESLSAYGSYLFCAYFEYPNAESPPELAASTQTAVIPPPPPCVVPGFTIGSPLASEEGRLRAASCSVGAIHYAASANVRRGGVIGLNPRPGTTIATGAPVAIYVSAGRPCVVPPVRAGATAKHVEHLLSAADCGYVVVHVRSRRVRRGAVIGLGSHARSRLFPLTRVRVLVSRGR